MKSKESKPRSAKEIEFDVGVLLDDAEHAVILVNPRGIREASLNDTELARIDLGAPLSNCATDRLTCLEVVGGDEGDELP